MAAQQSQTEQCVAMQVLHHVASRLAMLHQAGWVHHDLKPGNILRRPQMHSWTLIDFGCTSQIGVHLPADYPAHLSSNHVGNPSVTFLTFPSSSSALRAAAYLGCNDTCVP